MPDVYARLRERLDMFPQGFPKTKSGVELEILRYLFTPEEAEIMLSLRPNPEPVSAIADRMGRDAGELGAILYQMSRKGLIMRFRASEGQIFYFLAPWMVGIWEFQLKNLNSESIKLYERYFEEGIVQERSTRKTPSMRVIPIEKEIQGTTEIQPYEKVSEIIDANSRFAVADCICRKESRMLGKGCKKLLEACMTFGPAAEYYIENGLGREISKEEARQIILKAEEEGLVHCSSNHEGDKIFICNCCGCCCKALGFVTKYDMPAAIATSNYYAMVDEETCSACEICVERCQVSAIRVEDESAIVDKKRCIGCGLCVSSCPTGSISMVQKSPEEFSVILKDQIELLQTMGKEKSKTYPFQ